jgi:hypothetical protein
VASAGGGRLGRKLVSQVPLIAGDVVAHRCREVQQVLERDLRQNKALRTRP